MAEPARRSAAPEGSGLLVSARESVPGIYKLELVGTLDLDSFAKVEEVIRDGFRLLAYEWVIDMAGVTNASPAVFSLFFPLLAEARENTGNFAFVSAPPAVRDVFQGLGLGSILLFEDAADKATTMLRRRPAPSR